MEVLSIGEKIKRARIYKGLTLKEVCDNKISLSKLSCIENNKLTPDKDLLHYLSSKFNIEYNYLKKDEKQQIIENLAFLQNSKDDTDYEENMKYCFAYAKKNKFYDIEFDIIHNAFTYFIQKGKYKCIQKIICEYYYLNKYMDIEDKNKYLYCTDMAHYYYINEELIQSINYCNIIIKNELNKKIKADILIDALYCKCLCYIKMQMYNGALKLIKTLLDLIYEIDDNIKKASVYKIAAGLSLRVNNKEFEKYALLSLKFNDCNKNKAETLLYYSSIMFDVGFYSKGLQYVKKSIEIYVDKDKDKDQYIKFLTSVIQILLKNNIIDKFCYLYDKLLDYSIETKKIEFIENAYYLKTLMLLKNCDYKNAEVCINISLNFLNKLGDNQKLYNRYIQLGYLYYKLNNAKESLNYYILAIELNDKYLKDYTLI